MTFCSPSGLLLSSPPPARLPQRFWIRMASQNPAHPLHLAAAVNAGSTVAGEDDINR